MTVQSSVSRNDYAGNGTADTFPYTYQIRDESHLRLIVTNPSGAETVLVIDTDYTVTGVNIGSGGNVVLVNAAQAWLTAGKLSTGYDLAVIRRVPILQETDLRNQGAYFPESVEDELDNSRRIDQQQQEEIDRCIKLPMGQEGSDSTLPELVGGLYVRVNAAGDGFELGTPSSTTSAYNGNLSSGLYASRSATPSTNDVYIPTDKPGMICVCYASNTWTDFKMRYFGLDAAKAASPKAGDSFLATDTKKIYRCFVDGTWMTLTNGTKGTTIASATTCDIGAANGEFVDISGTVTITGLGTIGAGAVRKVRFLGALTLTHNGTSLILPGAANITTAANDAAEFVSLGSGNWFCLSYTKASGRSVVEFTPSAANALVGSVVQVKYVENVAYADITANIAYDAGYPEVTEGAQVLSDSITPNNAANKIQVDVLLNLGTAGTQNVTGAVFKDGATNAIASGFQYIAVNESGQIKIRKTIDAGSTSAQTFTVRVGGPSNNTAINGANGAIKHGGSLISSMTLTEIKG